MLAKLSDIILKCKAYYTQTTIFNETAVDHFIRFIHIFYNYLYEIISYILNKFGKLIFYISILFKVWPFFLYHKFCLLVIFLNWIYNSRSYYKLLY